MNVPVAESIRLGPATKTRLSTLKRRTGHDNWNVLCRWAFCLSITDSEKIQERNDDPGTAIEMSWKTFAGDHEGIYQLLLVNRAEQDGINTDHINWSELIRRHVVRGVTRLVSSKQTDSISLFVLADKR